MKFPIQFAFAIVMAAAWLGQHNHAACAVWTAAALIISCFRKDAA